MRHRRLTPLLHLASRLKRTVHALSAPRTTPAPPVTDLTALLFPGGVDAGVARFIDDVTDEGRDVSIAAIRRVLGGVDRQTTATPFFARPAVADIVYVDVGGIGLALDRADASVSGPIIRDGEWEPHVEATLRAELRPGSTFVDVGANVGYHAVLGSGLVGRTGRVVAVEANPDNARLIAHTIEHNGIENVELLPFALGVSTGWVAFTSAIGSNGGFAATADRRDFDPSLTIVPTIRMDDLDLGHVHVIKIDVEGAEPIVLAGAAATIERDRPVVVFEFSMEMTERIGGTTARGHLGWFVERGYALAIIDKETGARRPVLDLDATLAGWGDPLRIEDMVATPSG